MKCTKCQGTTLVVPIRLVKCAGFYRLRKNPIEATVLKGHGFIRADKAN
jgi:hypothetical protein